MFPIFLAMIFLFAHKRRAYLALGLPVTESSNEIKILFAKRLEASDRQKLIRDISRELAFERVRPNVPFRAYNSTVALIDTQGYEGLKRGLPHNAFAIFTTKDGFVLRSLQRKQTGGWVESLKPLIDGVIRPHKWEGYLEYVASHAVGFLLQLLDKQKRRGAFAT